MTLNKKELFIRELTLPEGDLAFLSKWALSFLLNKPSF